MQKILLTLLFLSLSLTSYAQVKITLDDPNTEPLPIAVSPFQAEVGTETAARTIREVIDGNFKNSTLFNAINPSAYLQTVESLNKTGPIFKDWAVINTDLLVFGNVAMEGGKLKVSFRLFDVPNKKEILGWRYKVSPKFARYVGHLISDRIYKEVTGEEGYFATRIVYIGEEQGRIAGKPQVLKKLCVMDQDGANQQCLTDGRHLVLTPRFNPNVQKIIYMSYASGRPRLYLLDLPTGKQKIVGDFEGLNSSPRFAPDGKNVVMTLTKGHAGNPEIYRMNLNSRKLTRLTQNSGIDTSPSFSPDGKKIVFNSTRGGKPNLYIMDANGRNVKRLTYGEGSYFAPEWSPRGDLIAFVKQRKGRFHIGVIDPDGDEERLLTESFLDESPTWSPNGRVVIFARQLGNRTRLYAIDLTGYNERQIITPTDASDPAWSPLLE